MAMPEIIEDVTFRASRGRLFAYDGERLIGQVTNVDEGIHVRLMGKKHRGWLRVTRDWSESEVEVPSGTDASD